MAQGISIIVPTLNGGALFERSLATMRQQNFDGDVQIVIIDSGSRDRTIEVARRFDAEVTSIPPSEFHHARTRNFSLRLTRHSLVLFMVQDAVPIDSNWLSTCVSCLEDTSIAAAFGRQIPHADADLYARYSVERLNEFLGERRKVHSLSKDHDLAHADFETALKAITLDNVCAIYRRRVLEEIAFPEVPIGEDLAWSLRAQQAGHRILCEPAIRVYHSHNRQPEYDFRRALAGFVSTSRILGKLPLDRGSLGMPEILEVKRCLRKLEEELFERPISRRYTFAAALGSRILRSLYRRFHGLVPASPKKRLCFEKRVSMVSQYEDARRRYPQADAGEWKRFLSRLSASEYGKFVAEVYLSCEFRSAIPKDLEEFVVSNMKGV